MKTCCPRCSKSWGGLKTAHCSKCHLTFTTAYAFDLHQTFKKGSVQCRDPSSVGLVFVDWRDAYRFMAIDEEEDSVTRVQDQAQQAL